MSTVDKPWHSLSMDEVAATVAAGEEVLAGAASLAIVDVAVSLMI